MYYSELVVNMYQTPSAANNDNEEVSENGPFWVKALDILYLTLCITWGVFGNIVIITTIIRLRHQRKLGHVFLAHLAVADMVNSAFIMPLILANVVLGSNATNDATCHLSGVMIIFTCGMSVYSIVLIAVQRYLKICKPEMHAKVFAPCGTVVVVMCLWAFCTISSTPPLYGWSKIQYNKEQYLCGYSRSAAYSYNIFIFIVGIVIPTLTLIFCYTSIFKEFNKNDRRLLLSSGGDAQRVLRQTNANRKRATLTMLLITVMFAIFCGPYGVLIVADRYNVLPGMVHKLAAFLGLGNSCVNSIILITRCGEFNAAVKQLLCTPCRKFSRRELRQSADPLVYSSTSA